MFALFFSFFWRLRRRDVVFVVIVVVAVVVVVVVDAFVRTEQTDLSVDSLNFSVEKKFGRKKNWP